MNRDLGARATAQFFANTEFGVDVSRRTVQIAGEHVLIRTPSEICKTTRFQYLPFPLMRKLKLVIEIPQLTQREQYEIRKSTESLLLETYITILYLVMLLKGNEALNHQIPFQCKLHLRA